MGIFSWLSRGSKEAEGRSQRSIAKQVRKLLNESLQTAERLRIISNLSADGSDDAIYGLCMRFTYRAPVTIVDEDEKEKAYEGLLAFGDRAIPALQRFLHDEATGVRVREIAGERFTAGLPSVYWPLRALTAIAGQDAAVDLLLAELDRSSEGFNRDEQQRVELASHLRDFQIPRVFAKLMDLLADENEEIVVIAIDGLTAFESSEVIEPLVAVVLKEGQSARLRNMIIEYLFEKELPVKKWKKEISAVVPPAFWVDDTGVIRRR